MRHRSNLGLVPWPRLVLVAGLALLVLSLAGCTAGAGAASSASATSGSSPAASIAASGGAGTGTGTGTGTAEGAFASVQARSPWFDGLARRDPQAIGQAAWWDATSASEGAWLVTVQIGWGDCQAGCINRHVWRWLVAPGGSVTLQTQSGPAIPDDQRRALAAKATESGIGGEVTAGPTCPVQRPGDSACGERPVEGAVLVVQDAAGKQVATFTTDASGLFRMAVPAGSYTVVSRAVAGLMGTARPQPVSVAGGRLTLVAISYDTGIR